MEFAFRHDDGQHTEDLKDAEIVIVGVSRTFKTPLSVYLAFKRWLVANVPIVLNLEPPAILSELATDRVIGLTSNVDSLAVLRRVRLRYLGGVPAQYGDVDYVRREVMYALKIFEKHNWPVIDVTGKPIEEIASEIVALVRHTHLHE